jgi:hypothetical protein
MANPLFLIGHMHCRIDKDSTLRREAGSKTEKLESETDSFPYCERLWLMSRKESYKEPLAKLIDGFLRTGDEKNLKKYLVSNSNLPGPRGNLELADVFALVVKGKAEKEAEKLWTLCQKLTQLCLVEAPVNSPEEFLVFCGARGIGALGASTAKFFHEALSRLKELASDKRWRTREGVAMSVQSMIGKQPQRTLNEIEKWIENDDWLAMRAVAAGVAEPALLKDKETAKIALELHKKIFGKIATARERKTEFNVLKQGLGYSLSVVVSATPEEGFEYMRMLAETKEPDVQWIVKENLKKNRLIKNFPEEVDAIKRTLK